MQLLGPPLAHPSLALCYPGVRVQVSYYGDADFATEDVMLVHDVNMADDPTVDVTAMLHSLPVEVQTLFSKLRKTWMEKVRARVLLVRVSVARAGE